MTVGKCDLMAQSILKFGIIHYSLTLFYLFIDGTYFATPMGGYVFVDVY